MSVGVCVCGWIFFFVRKKILCCVLIDKGVFFILDFFFVSVCIGGCLFIYVCRCVHVCINVCMCCSVGSKDGLSLEMSFFFFRF